MIIYNEIYCKEKIDEHCIFYSEKKYNDDLKIENSAIIIGSINSSHDILANYDLIVLGNIKAKNIRVLKNFICLGKVEFDNLEAEGDFISFGEITCNNISIGNSCRLDSGIINENGSIADDCIILKNLNVNGKLEVSNNIYCFEGIIGSGKIICNNLFVKEYIEVADKQYNKFILLDESMEEKKPDDLNFTLHDMQIYSDKIAEVFNNPTFLKITQIQHNINNKIKTNFNLWESHYEYEEIANFLINFSNINPEYLNDYSIFKDILQFSDLNSIKDLYTYLKILQLKKICPKYIKQISIAHSLFNNFLYKEKHNLSNMSLGINKYGKDFANFLCLLEENINHFTNEEYKFILFKLFNILGINMELFKKIVPL